MTRQISDSERLTLAKLNRTETENKKLREELSRAYAQLKAQTQYITDLKSSNKTLAAQVNYLVRKQLQNAN